MGFTGVLLGLLMFAGGVWVIYDVIRNHNDWIIGKKVLWIVLAIIFNLLTAIAYYFLIFKKPAAAV